MHKQNLRYFEKDASFLKLFVEYRKNERNNQCLKKLENKNQELFSYIIQMTSRRFAISNQFLFPLVLI